jgi:hypothetical protein
VYGLDAGAITSAVLARLRTRAVAAGAEAGAACAF